MGEKWRRFNDRLLEFTVTVALFTALYALGYVLYLAYIAE